MLRIDRQPSGTESARCCRAPTGGPLFAPRRLPRTCTARTPGLSIGVLTPQNKVAAQVVALLRRQGLDATGEGGGGASLIVAHRSSCLMHFVWPVIRVIPLPCSTCAHLLWQSCWGSMTGGRPDSDVSRELRGSFASRGIARTFEDWFARLAGQLDQRELTRLERLITETQRLEAGGADRSHHGSPRARVIEAG